MKRPAPPAAPVIGITSYPRLVDIVPVPSTLQTANAFYVDAIVRAGGCPVILAAVAPALAVAAVGAVDGLLLPGGSDVDPRLYGEEPEPETGAVDRGRDAWELACLAAALASRIPVLATCRGAQILNVALGGTLVQHLPAVTGEPHDVITRYAEAVHRVRLKPESRLARLLGTVELVTNSIHHQAVARLGDGVTAVGWAPDGTVEAIEVASHPEVVAVQWHPELLPADPLQALLFRNLVADADADADADAAAGAGRSATAARLPTRQRP